MFFNKEKDFVLKLTNIVLILWLIGAISALQFSVTDLLLKDPKLTRSEYEIYYCDWYKGYKEEVPMNVDERDKCVNRYDSYLVERGRYDSNKMKFVIMAFGNVVIVSTALYFINREGK